MKGLSPKQKQVLGILENAVREGQHLTVREIGDLIGVSSTCTVHQHLKALERKGYLKPTNHRHRSIQLTSPPRPFIAIPFSGTVAAGDGSAAPLPTSDTILLPSDLVGQGDKLLYQVRGDRLAHLSIRDGDLVVVSPGTEAQDGDMVVAQSQDEAVLCRVVCENGSTSLLPAGLAAANGEQDGLSLLGRVALVIRRL
jgi:repressor LexA